MSDDIAELEKAAKRAKRIASEKAAELHDLVEDRLPAAYEQLPALADAVYAACKLWAEADKALQAAQGK
jgi:hypothetical protein